MVMTFPSPSRVWNTGLNLWWPVGLGLALLFIPTYIRLNAGSWNDETYAHGPFVLLVVIWMIVRKWPSLIATEAKSAPIAGGATLFFGLLLYVVGRSQGLILFEVGAQIPILAGVVLLLLGWRALRTLWFPLFFLLFFVPLPGFVIDAATSPLKMQVSQVVESLLYMSGYPIARVGVTLHVGPYQLLVADACSGLNSIYSLSAMGLLYLYLMQHKSWTRNALLIASILPMAFMANVLRVIILVLVTYYMGDEAGQGFIHDFAGISLFIFGLLLLFALDNVLGLFFDRRQGQGKKHA